MYQSSSDSESTHAVCSAKEALSDMGAVKAKDKTEENTLLRKSRPPISSLYDTFNPRTYKGGVGGGWMPL